jgi:hypothetical protein
VGGRRSRIGGKLAVADLLAFIEALKISIKNSDIDLVINRMYDELKTSGWIENTNDFINQTADKITNLVTK